MSERLDSRRLEGGIWKRVRHRLGGEAMRERGSSVVHRQLESRALDGERERLPVSFEVQAPRAFRDDFAQSAEVARQRVLLETMQFEVTPDTRPLFEALLTAKQNGVGDVGFVYDRVARRHIRSADGGEANTMGGYVVAHPGGDGVALQLAYRQRESLISDLERRGITDPGNRGRGDRPSLSHNHVKIGVVDDVGWIATLNLRGVDFEKMSNFAVKIADKRWADVLQRVYAHTERGELGPDQVFADSDGETAVLFDTGVKHQSAIYDKALAMVDSLQAGDEFVIISQYPPLRMLFGDMVKKLQEKTRTGGARGVFLTNPADALHPSKMASKMMQKSMAKTWGDNENMVAENLPRQTHAKAFLIIRADGTKEVLFGSHNLTSLTVRNGTAEVAMWTKEPIVAGQVLSFLESVRQT